MKDQSLTILEKHHNKVYILALNNDVTQNLLFIFLTGFSVTIMFKLAEITIGDSED